MDWIENRAKQQACQTRGEAPTVALHFCHGPAKELHCPPRSSRYYNLLGNCQIWNSRGRIMRPISADLLCAHLGELAGEARGFVSWQKAAKAPRRCGEPTAICHAGRNAAVLPGSDNDRSGRAG